MKSNLAVVLRTVISYDRRISIDRRITCLLLLAAVSGFSQVQVQYRIDTVVGQPFQSGSPVSLRALVDPIGLFVDPFNNLYIAEGGRFLVDKIANGTTITTVVAGYGPKTGQELAGYSAGSGDGGPATSATFNDGFYLTQDPQGNLYIADNTVNCAIRRVDAATGIITTYAGIIGQCGYNGDGIPATSAKLGGGITNSITFDPSGNLYIADPANARIRKVDALTHIITTIAGTGTPGYAGNGIAVDSQIDFPVSPVFDTAGNLYFGDGIFVRRIDTEGNITFYAGTGNETYNGEGLPALDTNIGVIYSVAIDSSNNLYFVDHTNLRVREILSANQTVVTVAGTGNSGYSGDGGSAINATFVNPFGVAVDSNGNVYISDVVPNVVRKVSGGIISTYAGFRGPENVPPTAALLNFPGGLFLDSSGDLFICDEGNGRIREVNASFTDIKTVAGRGYISSGGDGGPALNAGLSSPADITLDAAGNYYIADQGNSSIRFVNAATGIISTFAGTGTSGFGGDDGPATSAMLASPVGVVFSPSGTTLYVSDSGNNRIRAISNGTITTIAGTGTAGFSGDGGLAVNAELNAPVGLRVDSAGNIFFSDNGNNRVREIRALDQTIVTIAGNGIAGYSGDGGLATSAELNYPYFITFDGAGNLLIPDAYNSVIRQVTPSGIITTIAGTAVTGDSGDGGPATAAQLGFPLGLVVDDVGHVYIADAFRDVIRRLTPEFSTVIPPPLPALQFSANQVTFATSSSTSATQTIAVSSNNGTAVSFQATANSQGNWLSVSPGSASTPATLTITANPSGLSPGLYEGTINFAVDGSTVASLAVQLTVQPPLTVTTGTGTGIGSIPVVLAETGNSGIFSADIPLVTTFSGSPFTAAVTGVAGIAITPASGTLPSLLHVSVDTTSLAPGAYQATVTINIPDATPSAVTIPVSFAVASPQPNQITAAAGGLTLALTTSSPQASRQVLVTNVGNAAITFQASANQPWIQVSPTSGMTNSAGAVPLSVTLNLTGFAPGTYNGAITVTSAAASATASARASAATIVTIPVHVAVSGQAGALEVLQSGLTFQAVNGGPSPAPQSFQVLASGTGTLQFQVATSTTSGGQWLSVTPNAGNAASTGTNATVQVNVNPAGLVAGAYYGLVQVASAGVSSQYLTIVLNVAAAGTHVPASVEPTGLAFSTVAGAANPPPQTIAISNPNNTAVSFVSADFYDGGIVWFGSNPAAGQIAGGQTQLITVQPTPSTFTQSLPAGVYTGKLAIAFDDNTVSTIALLMVVAPGGSSTTASSVKLSPRAAGACTPTELLPVFTSLGAGFTVAAGWPQSIIVQILDDCGNPMTTGSVVASFSNGDPPLSLISNNTGTWDGTWVLGNPSPMTAVTATAQMQTPAGQTISGSAVINGAGQANPLVPLLSPGGVVNAASFATSSTLAPGSFVTIFGSALSAQTASASQLPLPGQLANTSALIAGQSVPLQYTSSGQVNAVLPFGLPQNSSQQLIVVNGNSLSAPQTITISSAQPGIFSANGSGSGQGIILGVMADGSQVLADATNPVSAGEAVVMYATGLGSVAPPVMDGSAAPSSPLSRLTDPATVTIGGANAKILYAGLAPGFAGLYQVDAIVPASTTTGNSVPVVITVDGQSSPVVTIAVQ